jgi:hypothetical protein
MPAKGSSLETGRVCDDQKAELEGFGQADVLEPEADERASVTFPRSSARRKRMKAEPCDVTNACSLERQALAATRRKSTSLMLTPGAAQLLAGGADCRACSSVSNTTNEKPCPSAGSSQYPATKPGAARILGRSSCVSASAAAGAWSGSIVKLTSAACMFSFRRGTS